MLSRKQLQELAELRSELEAQEVIPVPAPADEEPQEAERTVWHVVRANPPAVRAGYRGRGWHRARRLGQE